MIKKRDRFLAWAVLFAFSLVMLGSSVFIVLHTEHACTGDDCPVCAALADHHKNLNMLGADSAGEFHIPLMLFIVYVLERAVISTRSKHMTLISLKVELLS